MSVKITIQDASHATAQTYLNVSWLKISAEDGSDVTVFMPLQAAEQIATIFNNALQAPGASVAA